MVCDLNTAILEEDKWIDQGIQLFLKEHLTKEDHISLGAFHASQNYYKPDHAVLNSLLPLFYEKAASSCLLNP